MRLATFTDSQATDTAPDFSGVVNWGDNSTGIATITESNGTFTVSGAHTYTNPGTFSITVTIANQQGKTIVVNDTATVVNTNPPSGPVPFNFSGGLANAITNGPHSALGYTNTNRPTFSGTAAPFSIVQLYARHFNADAQLPLGEAVTNGSGQWTLTSGPLAVGTYIVTATVTLPGGYPSKA